MAMTQEEFAQYVTDGLDNELDDELGIYFRPRVHGREIIVTIHDAYTAATVNKFTLTVSS